MPFPFRDDERTIGLYFRRQIDLGRSDAPATKRKNWATIAEDELFPKAWDIVILADDDHRRLVDLLHIQLNFHAINAMPLYPISC